MPFRGLITSSSNGVVRPKSALLTHRVEEARAYVQGESLKASADLLDEALSTPRSPGRRGYETIRFDCCIYFAGWLR